MQNKIYIYYVQNLNLRLQDFHGGDKAPSNFNNSEILLEQPDIKQCDTKKSDRKQAFKHPFVSNFKNPEQLLEQPDIKQCDTKKSDRKQASKYSSPLRQLGDFFPPTLQTSTLISQQSDIKQSDTKKI